MQARGSGGDAENNAKALEAVLTGHDRGPDRDALVLGAGLLLEVTGRKPNLREGIATAGEAIDSGATVRLLKQLRAFSSAMQ